MSGYIGRCLKIFDDVDIKNQNTIYSNSIEIGSNQVFGLAIKATSSSSAPDLKVELEQSFTKPTTEGSSDNNWVVPDGVSDIYTNLTSENLKIKAISPVPMRFMRIKITGNAGNASDTKVTAYLFVQELV